MKKIKLISVMLVLTILCSCGLKNNKNTSDNFSEGKKAANNITEFCPESAYEKRTDIDYSTFTHGTYVSKTCEMERGYSILLPKAYSEDKKYPVLYLLHGLFGDETTLPNDSKMRVTEIIENMEADGLIDDLIVVCPYIYATNNPSQRPAYNVDDLLPYDNFINELVNDLMPYIESNYSVLSDRENTYLAGFSMGGRETLYIALNKPELFSYVASISPAQGIVPTPDGNLPGQMTEEEMKFADDANLPNALILCCGTNDNVVGDYPKSYHDILTKNGVNHIWYEMTDVNHDEEAFKSGLYNLLMQISVGQTK